MGIKSDAGAVEVTTKGVAVRITSAVGSMDRGKIRTTPIWIISRIAARADGMSIRLEQSTRMIVSDQAKALGLKRERVAVWRRAVTDPAISGVRGYSIPVTLERNLFSNSISFMFQALRPA